MSSNVNLHITPSNVLSSGKISYKAGNPVIQFIVGEQDRLLLGNSIRICGKFSIWTNAGGTEIPVGGDNLAMDERLGVYSTIDQVVIKSQATHQVIEHIRHYNRFMASYLPSTTSQQDGVGHLSETTLGLPNYNIQKLSVVDMEAGHTSGNDFCLHLPCGLFNGTQGIPLSGSGGVGGLLIELHLAPDNNVLFSNKATAGADNLTDSFYEFSDVFLACEAVEDVRPPGQTSTFEYNSVSSYFASINSTNAIINFNLGLSRVLGIAMNFLPSFMINNFNYNGMTAGPLTNKNGRTANIKQIIFTRGGQKYPFMYNLDLEQLNVPTQLKYDPVFVRNSLDATKSFAKAGRTQISSRTSRLDNPSAGPGNNPIGNGTGQLITADGGPTFTLGVGFYSISNQGISFSTESFGLNLLTELTSDFPHACFVFAHAKNTLVFGPVGVQVIN